MEPYEIPGGEVLDLGNVRDPYPQLERIRARCPVAHESVTNSYLVVSHGGVDSVLRNTELARDPLKAAPGTRMAMFRRPTDDSIQHSMLFLDPPKHTRLRGVVRRAFTPRAVERMTGTIEAWTDRLLDAVEGQRSFDLMDALARPLPTIVIAELLGVDHRDHADFKRWSDQAVRGFDPLLDEAGVAAVREARLEFTAYLERLLAQRRAEPRDDMVTELLQAQRGGAQLTDDEIVVTCRLVLGAGNITTTDLIGNGMLALLRHPDQLALLRAEPDRIDAAVEEMLRYQSPVVVTARIATEDMEVHGCPIAKGQSVFVSLAAANHDPDVYEDPTRFDITREDTHHHSFGGGLHYCLGAHLARLEARIAFGSLLARFPAMRLADDFVERRGEIPGFHSLEGLSVVV